MERKINHLTAIQLREKLDTGEIPQHEVFGAYFDEIGRINPQINSIVTLCNDRPALNSIIPSAGRPLSGIPVTIKDHFATKGIRTTNGARAFSGFVPGYDTPVVRKLKEAGAFILGKTNLPPFAMDFQGRNLLFGVTDKPWDLTRTSGGVQQVQRQ